MEKRWQDINKIQISIKVLVYLKLSIMDFIEGIKEVCWRILRKKISIIQI